MRNMCSAITFIFPLKTEDFSQTALHRKWAREILTEVFLAALVFVAGSRSSSPGKLLGHTYGRVPRTTAMASTPSDKRARVPRSQGCSRETSPNRLGIGKDTHGVLMFLAFKSQRSKHS